jgi:hypothetical protein
VVQWAVDKISIQKWYYLLTDLKPRQTTCFIVCDTL